MGIGMATTSLENALIIHAIAAPVIFCIVSFSYFRRSDHLNPLLGTIAFVVFVIAMDFFVVALMINRSLVMFTSLLGTWIPFGLIFASTYITGIALGHGSRVTDSRSAVSSAATPDGAEGTTVLVGVSLMQGRKTFTRNPRRRNSLGNTSGFSAVQDNLS